MILRALTVLLISIFAISCTKQDPIAQVPGQADGFGSTAQVPGGKGTEDATGGDPLTYEDMKESDLKTVLDKTIKTLFEDPRYAMYAVLLVENDAQLSPFTELDSTDEDLVSAKERAQEHIDKALAFSDWHVTEASAKKTKYFSLFSSPWSIVNERIRMKDKCISTEDNLNHLATTVTPKGGDNTGSKSWVCFSSEKLREIPKSHFREQVISVLGHEICHLNGEEDHDVCNHVQVFFERVASMTEHTHMSVWQEMMTAVTRKIKNRLISAQISRSTDETLSALPSLAYQLERAYYLTKANPCLLNQKITSYEYASRNQLFLERNSSLLDDVDAIAQKVDAALNYIDHIEPIFYGRATTIYNEDRTQGLIGTLSERVDSVVISSTYYQALFLINDIADLPQCKLSYSVDVTSAR